MPTPSPIPEKQSIREAILHLFARYREMRPLFLAAARPMKVEWKMSPYFGVLPLVFRALGEEYSVENLRPEVSTLLAKAAPPLRLSPPPKKVPFRFWILSDFLLWAMFLSSPDCHWSCVFPRFKSSIVCLVPHWPQTHMGYKIRADTSRRLLFVCCYPRDILKCCEERCAPELTAKHFSFPLMMTLIKAIASHWWRLNHPSVYFWISPNEERERNYFQIAK